MILAAWYHPILAVLFAFFAVLLIGVVLLQRGRGVGLSGAFGGAGGQSAFGAKTGDFLTWVTVGLAITVLVLAVLLNYAFRPAPIVDESAAAVSSATSPTHVRPAAFEFELYDDAKA